MGNNNIYYLYVDICIKMFSFVFTFYCALFLQVRLRVNSIMTLWATKETHSGQYQLALEPFVRN
jgi:hypothetical protein